MLYYGHNWKKSAHCIHRSTTLGADFSALCPLSMPPSLSFSRKVIKMLSRFSLFIFATNCPTIPQYHWYQYHSILSKWRTWTISKFFPPVRIYMAWMNIFSTRGLYKYSEWNLHTRHTYTNTIHVRICKTHTKHTQEPTYSCSYTKTCTHMRYATMFKTSFFYHFCHHWVRYQESNISSIVQ